MLLTAEWMGPSVPNVIASVIAPNSQSPIDLDIPTADNSPTLVLQMVDSEHDILSDSSLAAANSRNIAGII